MNKSHREGNTRKQQRNAEVLLRSPQIYKSANYKHYAYNIKKISNIKMSHINYNKREALKLISAWNLTLRPFKIIRFSCSWNLKSEH